MSELTNGSTRNEKSPPQPFAPGAPNAVFTGTPTDSVSTPASLTFASPALPWMGLFGGGGEVSTVVESIGTGLEFEPMWQLLPRNALSSLIFTGGERPVPLSL